MTELNFDIFIIGAGSGGVRAARLAAAAGAKVAIAEEDRYGGTCVIRGCVPKKLMVNAADFRDSFFDSIGFGWTVENTSFSWEKFLKAKNQEIRRLETLYYDNLKKSGVKIFGKHAKLKSPTAVQLENGTVYNSKIILIASGSRPFIPEFLGKEYAITSNEVFNLKKLPKKMLIVGGGYIASEFSGIFNGMGVNVTQAYRGTKLLRGFDDDLRDHLTEAMIHRGIEVKCSVEVLKCEKLSSGFLVSLSDNSTLETDCLVVATGRKPNTDNLGLKKVGVKLDCDGAVQTNCLQQTSVSSVYAIGDATNRLNLTPVAIRDAIAFVETVVKERPTSPDHSLVPTAVFTRPEIGTIGLTEEQAKENYSVQVYKTKFRPLANTISKRDERTLMKMIVDDKSRRVLGCHLIGPNAAELIQLAAVAIKMGCSKEDFDRTCAVHPTMAEELVTLD